MSNFYVIVQLLFSSYNGIVAEPKRFVSFILVFFFRWN